MICKLLLKIMCGIAFFREQENTLPIRLKRLRTACSGAFLFLFIECTTLAGMKGKYKDTPEFKICSFVK